MYASVFPVPVGASPTTSLRSREAGRLASWMGVGLLIPILSRPFKTRGFREKGSNVDMSVPMTIWGPSLSGHLLRGSAKDGNRCGVVPEPEEVPWHA